MIELYVSRWSVIGMLRTPAISRSNTKSTVTMPCLITRNRESGWPRRKRFTIRRMIGGGDLWVTEFVLTYDGIPSYAVSIMEFRDGLVANETQYFAGQFDPGPSRAHLVEPFVTTNP